MVRIAGFPVWVSPSELAEGARAVLGWTDEAVGVVAELPRRVSGLLDEAGTLVGRIGAIADVVEILLAEVQDAVNRVDAVVGGAAGLIERVELVAEGAAVLVGRVDDVARDATVLVGRVGGVAEEASGIVGTASAVAERAGGVVGQAAEAADTASGLLATYRPALERAAPLADEFVREFSADELRAAIRLVDQLPKLAEHMEDDIMPILATLDRVGPDVHELLDVLKDTRQAIVGIPGFGLLRRRGEEKEKEENGD